MHSVKATKIISIFIAAALAFFAFTMVGCSSSASSSSSVEETKTVRIGIKSDFIGILDSVTPKIEALGYKVE